MADTSHSTFAAFQPGGAVLLGYDDLKVMQAHDFATSIADERQSAPSVDDAVAAGRTLAAMERSWLSERWEAVAEEGETRSEYGRGPVSSPRATRSNPAQPRDTGNEERRA